LLTHFNNLRTCDTNYPCSKSHEKFTGILSGELIRKLFKVNNITSLYCKVYIMARKKRSSPALEKAVRRAASINSIDSNIDLGNGLTQQAFSSLIETMRTKENAYNSALSSLDKLYREMLETERELGDMTEHMLLGVAIRYGKSSVEYGMAGGVPKNQRRRRLRGESPSPSLQQPSKVASVDGNGNGKKAAATT
jgi:hypothetical protein